MQIRASSQQIADSLRSRIEIGSLKSGDRLPSFEQLRRQHGASWATATRVYNMLERDGLVERRRRSGVYVAHMAPLKRRTRIAVAVADPHQFESDYWTRLHSGIQSAARSLGVEIAYLPAVDGTDWSDYSALLAYYNHPFETPDGLPAVIIGPAAFRKPSVGVNEYDAGFLATQHLIDLGHIRIGFLGQLSVTHTCLRLAGYHAAYGVCDEFNEHLLSYRNAISLSGRVAPMGDDRLIRTFGFTMAAATLVGEEYFAGLGYGNMEQWLKDGFAALECTAIVAHNDFAAEGVMSCLRDHGYRVPHDVSVVGFDNERRCAEMTPPLTSVGADMREVGARAVKTLVDAVQGLPVSSSMVEPYLFQRESTAPPPKGKKTGS